MDAPLYTNKIHPLCISPFLGQIRHTVDNKNKFKFAAYQQPHLAVYIIYY